MEKLITAIAFNKENKAYKYRRIINRLGTVEKFENFLRSKNIVYVNYYDKETRKFIQQRRL
jgi:hypothetical protein